MTGGAAIILGQVGDNFGAGMTGGMAFIFDEKKNFENYVNPNSVIWQPVETDFWKKYLNDILKQFYNETNSKIAKRIITEYDRELKNFIQVCPIEMLDKLENPISFKEIKSKIA